MGLDDVLPDDADTSGSSSSRSRSTSSEKEYAEEFHSDKGVKKYTEERWEEIKQEIREKFEYTVNEVKNMQSEKRHDVLHEAAVSSDNDHNPEELEHGTDITCSVCGKDCSYGYVELEDETFCTNHPAIQVAKSLGKEMHSIDHENN